MSTSVNWFPAIALILATSDEPEAPAPSTTTPMPAFHAAPTLLTVRIFVPDAIDPVSFRLRVHGLVERELGLSLHDLRTKYEPVELAAVCECSGNSRGYFAPRVAEKLKKG